MEIKIEFAFEIDFRENMGYDKPIDYTGLKAIFCKTRNKGR